MGFHEVLLFYNYLKTPGGVLPVITTIWRVFPVSAYKDMLQHPPFQR